MSLGYVTNDQFAQINVTAGAEFVFLPGNVLISSTGGFHGNENISIHLASSVYASDSAVAIGSSSVNNDTSILTVEAGVTVYSSDYIAVLLRGDTSELTNAGTIQSIGEFTVNHAVNSFGLLNTVNTGSILSAAGNGVQINGDSGEGLSAVNSLLNTGTISGRDGVSQSRNTLALHNTGLIEAVRDGVLAEANGALDITNGGTITAGDSAVRGHDTSGQDDILRNLAGGVLNGNVWLFAGNNTIYNQGDIHGEVRNLSGDDLLDNSGNITGDVLMGFGTDTLLNTGRIAGDVDAGDGNDAVTNTGQVFGTLALGAGTDSFDGRGGTVDGVVQGLNGNDVFYIDQDGARIDGGNGADIAYLWASDVIVTTVENVYLMGGDNLVLEGSRGDDNVQGNEGNNRLTGGSDGDDTLFGNGGNDLIDGGTGNDSLNGGAGADEVLGGDGNDVVRGKGGDDEIEGGAGDDTITGDNGNDTILAGEGIDVIRPGPGADTLVFDSALEMDGDFVRGFLPGTDVIDLSGIEDAGFDWLGTGGFTGNAMELRYRVTANGHSLVQIDVDGDGTRDAQLSLLGVTALSVDDFVL